MVKKSASKSCRLSVRGLVAAGCLWYAFPAIGWDQLYVFGDSLSDSGNNGRYTWDGDRHPLYNDVLAEKMGQRLQPSSSGGTNYAAGGAVAVPALNAADNTQDQVQAYLAANNGQADGEGLYIHWIGGNDLAAAALNPLAAEGIVNDSAFAAASQVHSLLSAGANTVIAPTVPNIGATPALLMSVIQAGLTPVADAALAAAFHSLNAQATATATARQQAIYDALFAAAGAATSDTPLQQAIAGQLMAAWQQVSLQAAALTDSYNHQEERYLTQLNGNIVRVDIDGLFNEVMADPGRYGLSNTVGMACPPGVSAALCHTSTPGFAREQAFLFADGLHPGPATHLLIGDYIQSVLDAPAQVVALNQATLAMSRDMRNTLDSHLQQLRQSDAPQGSRSVYGGYAGQHYDYSANTSAGAGNDTTHNLTIGADYKLTDSWLVGMLVSGSNDKQQPAPDYDYKMRGWLVSAYSQLGFFENGWVNADVHYAAVDYDDIKRQFALGPARRTESGSTEGKQLGARITTGWDFPLSSLMTTGPVAQYALDYSHVSGYRESGNDSTAMRFDDQTYHSQIGAVGWRVDSALGWVNPWAEMTWNHQFGDNVWRAGGGLKSTQTSFTRDTAGQDVNWLDVTVGAHVPIGEDIAAFASVSQTGGLSSGEQFMYNLGVSARF